MYQFRSRNAPLSVWILSGYEPIKTTGKLLKRVLQHMPFSARAYYQILNLYTCENHLILESNLIEEYIRNQLQEDLGYDQMSLKEYIDSFTGGPVNKSNKKNK